MAIQNAGKNSMLDHLGTEMTYAGLLDSTDTELTGGDPAYARKGVTWNASTGGEMTGICTLLVFDVPAGTTVSQVILMSAAATGTEYARYDATNEVFAGQGTCTIPSITVSI